MADGEEQKKRTESAEAAGDENRLARLCRMLGLGKLTREPRALSGGFLHKMFEVNTETGHFAVKALNPEITARPGALKNFSVSEQIANRLKGIIPVGCARAFRGEYVQELDGQYYLVYDFLPGRALSAGEITPEHAARIGAVLAKIHGADFSGIKLSDGDFGESGEPPVDWASFAAQGKERGASWSGRLEEMLPSLAMLTEKSRAAEAALSGGEVVCHCDMDAKNVLWHDGVPAVIDWEAAGLLPPCRDFLDTALYWSMKPGGRLDGQCFLAFLEAYRARGADGGRNLSKEAGCERELPSKQISGSESVRETDWEAVLYAGCAGRLGWLEYSLKRALGLCTADPAEQELGASQIVPTLDDIDSYTRLFPEIMELLENGGCP
ncbi:MAG: phosphotransferase [Lachnospiraceae bacterium]|nr:phosphotransferase [Lachnospiraceae bacterium]